MARDAGPRVRAVPARGFRRTGAGYSVWDEDERTGRLWAAELARVAPTRRALRRSQSRGGAPAGFGSSTSISSSLRCS